MVYHTGFASRCRRLGEISSPTDIAERSQRRGMQAGKLPLCTVLAVFIASAPGCHSFIPVGGSAAHASRHTGASQLAHVELLDGDHEADYDLSMESAAKRFQYLLAGGSSIDQMRDHLIGSRLRWRSDNRIHVGKSLISGAGFGIFATHDLEKGALVTFYPGDLRIRLEDGGHKALEEGVGYEFGEHVPSSRREVLRSLLLNESNGPEELDVVPVTATISVAGDPSVMDDPAYFGQFINDCAVCASLDGVEEYVIVAATRANARLTQVEGCHACAVTTRRVEAGQELYVSYGPPYWLGRLGASVEELEEATRRWREAKALLAEL